MARISSYPKDTTVQDNDAWVGTAFPNRQTKNFLAVDVAKYLNIKGKISISAQMVYKFEADPNEATTGNFYGINDGTAFSAVTSLNIHAVDLSGQNVVDFVTYLVGSDILISEQNNISEFGHYKVAAYTDNGNGFYTLALSYIGGSGVLVNQAYYDVANFVLASSVESDKTYVHNQAVPSATWNVQHNLNKFPSVTSVNNNNTKMFGEVTYIDANNLTISFSAGFSGKAYIN
jgi:hypothetical protein